MGIVSAGCVPFTSMDSRIGVVYGYLLSKYRWSVLPTFAHSMSNWSKKESPDYEAFSLMFRKSTNDNIRSEGLPPFTLWEAQLQVHVKWASLRILDLDASCLWTAKGIQHRFGWWLDKPDGKLKKRIRRCILSDQKQMPGEHEIFLLRPRRC